MDNKEFIEMLSNNIISVTINSVVKEGYFEIKDHIDKYNSNKISSKRLFLDNKLIPTKNTVITYLCNDCKNKKSILLKKFLLKKSLICRSCKEDDSKNINHSIYMRNTYNMYGKVKSFKIFKEKISIDELITNSKIEFDGESEYFKESYKSTHLTENEFSNISYKIFKVNGVLFNSNFKYIYSIKTNNQMKYSSYLYDNKNLINLNNLIYICDSCSELFSSTRKPKEKYINSKKYLCTKCYLSNRTFKIKNIININNKIVTYQSNPELKLITYCNSNNIIIENGPTVNFYFSEKLRRYHIDFYIPYFKFIVEIKGNHIWHKEQTISGKWNLKENAAIKYAKENNLTYFLIFDNKIDEFISSLMI
jgi:hypothetical protein